MSEVVFEAGQLRLSAEGGALSLRDARWPGLRLSGLAPSLTVDGGRLEPTAMDVQREGDALVATWRFAEPALTLRQAFTAMPGSGLRCASTLANESGRELVLNAVTLLATHGDAALGGPAARLLIESGYAAYVEAAGELPARLGASEARRQGASAAAGEAGYLPADALSGSVARARANTFTVAFDLEARRALLAGFDSYARWFGCFDYAVTAEAGVTGWAAGFDGSDLLVLPGETLALESFVLLSGDDPQALLDGYTAYVAERNGIVSLQRSPVTWCSWYPHRLGVSEERVLANAEVAAERLVPLGLEVMLLDLGWQEGYLPGAYAENDQFPHGLKWLSDRLGGLGLKLGAWAAPYTISEFDPVAKDHPDWLLQGPDGQPQSLGTWYWYPHGNIHALDLTHPGAQAHVRRAVASLAERGCRYLKTDFIGMASSPNARGRHDRRKVAAGGLEAAREGSRAIVEEMRRGDRDALMLNSNTFEPAGLGLYNLLYTCTDTGNTGFVGWKHLRACYTTVAAHTAKNRRWGIIQPSCMCIGLPGTIEEARLRATATFLAGGQVDIGDDLTILPEERWQVLEATLPSLGQSARPVDLFEPLPVRSLSYDGLASGRAADMTQSKPKVGPARLATARAPRGRRVDPAGSLRVRPAAVRGIRRRADHLVPVAPGAAGAGGGRPLLGLRVLERPVPGCGSDGWPAGCLPPPRRRCGPACAG